MIDTWAVTQNFKESFEDLSPAQINALSVEEWAARTNRQTPAQAAIAALDAVHGASVPTAPQQSPAPAQEPQQPPQGIDPNSDEYFHAWRQSRARGGEGRGIFDSIGSRSDEYTVAVRQQAGRTAYSQGNVVEPPRLTDRYVHQDDMRDIRSAAQRFSTPGNAFGI